MFEINVQPTRPLFTKVYVNVIRLRLKGASVLVAILMIGLILHDILRFTTNTSLIGYLFGSFTLFMFMVMPHIQARSQWNNNPSVREPRIYRLTEEGLSVEGQSFNIFHRWSNLTGIINIKNNIVL